MDISVRLNSGNVELSLPENAKFNMNAVTERGEAYTRLRQRCAARAATDAAVRTLPVTQVARISTCR